MNRHRRDRSTNTCSAKRSQDFLNLRRVTLAAGHDLISAASVVALQGLNFPRNHGLEGTRLTPAEMLLSGSPSGIAAARVLETLTELVMIIDHELHETGEHEVGDE